MKQIRLIYRTLQELCDFRHPYDVAFYYIHYIQFTYWVQSMKLKHAGTKLEEVFDIAQYALKTHHKVNQLYDKRYPYFFHLKMIYEQALLFKDLLTEDEFILALKIIFLHDIIEDARLTYNDVKELFGEDVAKGVFACTELRGINRAERHGPAYYELLKLDKVHTFCKLCDIHGNVAFGKITGSSMFAKYKQEYFKKIKPELYRPELVNFFHSFETKLFV